MVANQISPLTVITPPAERPEVELKSDGPSVKVNTNMVGGYQMTESLIRNTDSQVHLYSVTAW